MVPNPCQSINIYKNNKINVHEKVDTHILRSNAREFNFHLFLSTREWDFCYVYIYTRTALYAMKTRTDSTSLYFNTRVST